VQLKIHVRDAQPGDAPHAVRLIAELARTCGEDSPITERYVNQYLSCSGNGILLAEVEGQVVGLLSYSVRPNLYHAASVGLIEELIVGEDVRGGGVGSALLSEILRLLESMGCAEVSVSTLPDNKDAQRFYRSHGLVDEAVSLEKHFTQATSSEPGLMTTPQLIEVWS
jgi:ribosomal protein S18 acetylase RimI-like enzyme